MIFDVASWNKLWGHKELPKSRELRFTGQLSSTATESIKDYVNTSMFVQFCNKVINFTQDPVFHRLFPQTKIPQGPESKTPEFLPFWTIISKYDSCQ